MPSIRITFKTPDAVEYALDETFGRPEDDEEAGEARDKAKTFLEKFIRHGELVTITFDTDKQTATVEAAR